jgi:hypothetical protein
VKIAIAFFYLGDSSTAARAAQMLVGLSTRSREIVLANMKQSMSLALGILKSLYPRANLDVAGEGFPATCTNDEASKLVEDSSVMVECIIDMLPIYMS